VLRKILNAATITTAI